MTIAKKVLMVAHGHPDFVAGGGELAAYHLHNSVNTGEEFSSVFFARHNQTDLLHGGTPFSGTGRPNEILFHSNMPDWFRFSQPDKSKVWRDFREALDICQPDVVHFHHYLHLGLELIREVKNYCKDIPVVLTLHEYLAICHNRGQMINPVDNSLCYESKPASCAKCFSNYSAQDFMLREQFIKSHFSLIDQFISPSVFLKQRYTAWGIDTDKIRVIENLVETTRAPADQHNDNPTLDHITDTKNTPGDRPVRINFFGQINWFKGIDVLLDAVSKLPCAIRDNIQVGINGSGLEKQSQTLQRQIQSRLDELCNTVALHGPYQPSQLAGLMKNSDWIVVPSKWWENSPMVILEAKKFGVPVICSDIGGMAEKVTHQHTGLHFYARSSDALAEQLIYVIENPEIRERMSNNIRSAYNPTSSFREHTELYQSLLGTNENTSTTLKAA